MAFSLTASVSSTTISLIDGAPFQMESAEGLSGMDIVRHEQHGPLQNGATDLGYKLAPRFIKLNILFYATTDAILDSYRQQLMAVFKPLSSISTILTATRDDGEIRALTCFAVGDIPIALVPEERPGHLHRATVTLRASLPLWRSNSVTRGAFDYSVLSQWWLAGGAISVSDSKVNTELPGQGAGWSTITGGITGTWGVAVITAQDGIGGGRGVWGDAGSALFNKIGGTTRYTFNNAGDPLVGYVWPGGSAENFHAITNEINSSWWYWNGTAVQAVDTGGGDTNLASGGKWRSTYSGGTATNWTPQLPKATIFANPTEAKLNALASYMLGVVRGSVNVVNDGDVNAYPLMTLRGPISNPVIVNQTTGGTIDLTGAILGSTDVWSIDLRTGDKRLVDQIGANQMSGVTTLPIKMADFYLAPGPIAAGGTNIITVTSGSVGSAAYFTVEITNQYMSY